MKRIWVIIFVFIVGTIIMSSLFFQYKNIDFLEIKNISSTPQNFKVAFIADQVLGENSRKVLELIKKEGLTKKLIDGSIKDLITELNITEDELRSIYSIRENDFALIKTLKHEEIKKLHLDYSLLIVFAFRTFYGIEQVDSTEFRNKIRDTGCPSVTNLSTSIKEYPNLIIHDKGRKGSIYTTYKITQQGIEYTKSLIIALVESIRK